MGYTFDQSGHDKAIYKRHQLERLRHQLDIERGTFKNHWRELNDYILPRRGRFFLTDANKGDRRTKHILDSTGTLAARTLRSGMMSGVTSPARPWFRLGTPDADLNEFAPVKQWLYDVTMRMRSVFLRSNLYNVLPNIYGDLGVFATSAMSVEEDPDSVVRFFPFPIGSYMIANDDDLKVNVVFREFRMTVRQIVDKFGRDPADPTKIKWDNISSKVKSLFYTNNAEAWVDVVHCIIPNPKYDPDKLDAKYKKYASYYYEIGFSGQNSQGYYGAELEADKFLRESGFDYFPVMCPRWETTGEDVYGTNCPGMETLGDVKQLQTGEKRGLQALEKMVNPPMVGPTSLKKAQASILPGDITYVDTRDGLQGFRPAHEIRFDLNSLEAKQQQVRQRISRGFYEDLFLMLAQTDRRQITAREIEERHEEKLLALGPVLERLNQDLLDPLIDNTFAIMAKRGLLPPPPEEIQGMDLKVEYISIMAQAQKLAGIGAIERFTGFVGQVAQADPGVLDKLNTDQIVDEYGEITSIPPNIIRSDEEVAAIRQQRAEAQAQQAQMEQAKMAASAAKDLSQAEIDEGNALNLLTGGSAG